MAVVTYQYGNKFELGVWYYVIAPVAYIYRRIRALEDILDCYFLSQSNYHLLMVHSSLFSLFDPLAANSPPIEEYSDRRFINDR